MKTWSKLLVGAAIAASFTTGLAHAEDKELYFYNWSEYIPSDVLQDFTKETGIKVIYSTYESNEAMYAKLKTQGQGYDLVVPSTYFVSKMRKEGMLMKLDKSKLSHFADLDPNYLNKPLIQVMIIPFLIFGGDRYWYQHGYVGQVDHNQMG